MPQPKRHQIVCRVAVLERSTVALSIVDFMKYAKLITYSSGCRTLNQLLQTHSTINMHLLLISTGKITVRNPLTNFHLWNEMHGQASTIQPRCLFVATHWFTSYSPRSAFVFSFCRLLHLCRTRTHPYTKLLCVRSTRARIQLFANLNIEPETNNQYDHCSCACHQPRSRGSKLLFRCSFFVFFIRSALGR